MDTHNKLASAIRLATLGIASAAILATANSYAQTQENTEIEEIVVTGSAIKRDDLEGALPVQVLSREMIDKSGVITTSELIRTIPAMQGFTTQADSVGGGGGGIQTASLHDIGEAYTLVLLNGRRMAPANDGSTIDISSIPMSVLEQVEVLTDGASALYGSDAIAGVVNFKLKDEVEGTTVGGHYSDPENGAGESYDIDLSTGFGTLKADGYSLVAAFNHHEQNQLAAVDRDFAKTGILTVQHPIYGQPALFFNGSGNAIPGNATIQYIDTTKVDDPLTTQDERLTSSVFNPYYEANGECAPNNSYVGGLCFFDYTSTIEITPESKRDSVFLNGHVQVTDNLTAFATAIYSRNEMTTRIAPYPTGNVPIPLTSDLVATYITPYITQDQQDNLVGVTGTWRALPADNRTTEWTSDSTHLVLGLDGGYQDIDYSGAFTYARNSQEQNYPTGWLIREPFVDLVSSGGLDIFTTPDNISDAESQALQDTVYHGNWDETKVTVYAVDAVGSIPLMALPGGESVLAIGADYRDTTYDRSIAAANENEDLLFLSKDTPYDMNRTQWGVFAEYLMPIVSDVEVTASLRYDSISAVDSKGEGKVGQDMDDTTYKVSARWDATDNFALRASYGTGFKAPSMREIAEPLSEFGVTSGTYTCPFAGSDPLAQYCLPGEFQAAVYREGYAKLDPEKSDQYTAGLVFTPNDSSNLTVDYWNVKITDVVQRLTEQQIFEDPVTYRELYTTKTNLATNMDELAIIQAAVNAGRYDAEGIDYNFATGFDLSFGVLSTGISGTYMIKSDSSLTGTSLGIFGDNNNVTFRHRIRLSVNLDQEMFSHNVSLDFRSGYRDQAQAVNLITNGVPDFSEDTLIQLQVPSYYTINYQTRASLMEDKVNLTFGINNLMDEEPPLSLRTGGAGHQVGWDPRYVDAYGRTFYLQGAYTF